MRVTGLLADHGTSLLFQTGTISHWSRPGIGWFQTSRFTRFPGFLPRHLTAGTSCDSVPALPHVFSQWGNGKVVLWKLVTKALSCRAGVAFSLAPPIAISSSRQRTCGTHTTGAAQITNGRDFGLAHGLLRRRGAVPVFLLKVLSGASRSDLAPRDIAPRDIAIECPAFRERPQLL
jgi:hypothetical protein